jgi:hypothetical protein
MSSASPPIAASAKLVRPIGPSELSGSPAPASSHLCGLPAQETAAIRLALQTLMKPQRDGESVVNIGLNRRWTLVMLVEMKFDGGVRYSIISYHIGSID